MKLLPNCSYGVPKCLVNNLRRDRISNQVRVQLLRQLGWASFPIKQFSKLDDGAKPSGHDHVHALNYDQASAISQDSLTDIDEASQNPGQALRGELKPLVINLKNKVVLGRRSVACRHSIPINGVNP